MAEWPRTDLLTHRAETTPDRTALIDADTGESVTYQAFDAQVDTLAATLNERVDGSGRVATLFDTRPAVGRLLYSTLRCGQTLAPLNIELNADTIQSYLDRLGADLLVCESETETLAIEAANCPVVSVDAPTAADVAPLTPEAHTPASQTATQSVQPAELSRETTALSLFTSGTTNAPKGVKLTVGNLVASATASAFRLGVSPRDRWLTVLPTYHMGGLAPFVRCVLYGSAVVVQRAFNRTDTADAMAEFDVTGVSLVPTLLKRLLDSGWTPHPSLRFVLLGGGPATPELIERCFERDVPVCPTYGMTETASQIATALPDTAKSHPGTVGQPLICTDVTIQNDGGSLDDHGEIVVSGPTVTPGYLDPEQTAEAFGPYGFHTGDIGYRDEDGRLWIVGRLDDQIVTGGENVNAEMVSETLTACPGVDDAVVVGVPDEVWGERVAALVVGTADSEEIRTHCRSTLTDYEVPKTIAFTDELPRTPSGTVDRGAVRERFI
jgi:O-succinylbenzoic acid--CoA ligase